MRSRTIKKQFWLNESEDRLLKEKSKKQVYQKQNL